MLRKATLLPAPAPIHKSILFSAHCQLPLFPFPYFLLKLALAEMRREIEEEEEGGLGENGSSFFDGGFDKIINFTRNVIIRTHGDYLSQTKAASGLNGSIGSRLRRNSLWALRCARWRVRMVVVALCVARPSTGSQHLDQMRSSSWQNS